MKKVFIFFLILLFIIPFKVNAETIDSYIIGSNTLRKGQTVTYTIFIDRPLTEYEAIIKFNKIITAVLEILVYCAFGYYRRYIRAALRAACGEAAYRYGSKPRPAACRCCP